MKNKKHSSSTKCIIIATILFLLTNTKSQEADDKIWTTGELKGLNSLIQNTEIAIADVYLNKTLPWPLPTISLTATDIKCGNFSIGALAVNSPTYNNTYVELGFNAGDVDVDCQLDFVVATKGSVEIEGSGSGKVFTEGNSIGLSMGFYSEDFRSYPPNNATIDECEIRIKVSALEIDTPIPLVDNFIEQFKPLIETELNNMVTDTGCKKLNDQIQKTVPPLMARLTQFVEETNAANQTNTVALTNQALNNVTRIKQNVLNLTDESENNPSAWFVAGLNMLSPLLNFPIDDPATGGDDLAINYLLRSLSSAGGALPIPFSNPIPIFTINNTFIVAKLSIKSAALHGFDSFQTFSPFNITGPYVLRNDFKMEEFLVDLDFDLEFHAYDNETTSTLLINHGKTPSSLKKTTLQALILDNIPEGQPDTYQLSFTLSGGVNNLDMTVGNLLAMASDKLSIIDLACLSFTSEILPCFLSPVLKFMLLQLSFNSIPTVVQPTLSNSSNSDISKMLNPAFESIHHMYGDLLEETIPKLLDVQMRKAINPWIDTAIKDVQKSHKPTKEFYFGEEVFIDYRDLFLPPYKAVEYGANGTQPYGDVLPIIKGYMDTFFEKSNSSISGIINNYLIIPYTTSQSGEAGVMRFPASDDPYQPFFSASTNIDTGGLQANIVFHSPELKITNVDSFTYPFELLQPTNESAHTLENVATMGPPDAPLRITVPIYTSFKTPNIEKENYMEVSLTLQQMQLVLDVLAKINATAFFGLTLDKIYANPCEILATIPYVNSRSEYYPTFSIPQILFTVQEANLDLKCISCNNPDYWNNFISLLKTKEGIEDATYVVNNLSDYTLRTLFRDNRGKNIFQTSMDEVLKNATKLCDERTVFDFASINVLAPAKDQDIDYIDTSSGQIMYIALSLLVCLLFIVFISKLMQYLIRRSYKEWYLFYATPEQKRQVQKEDKQREEIERYLNLSTDSLVKSKDTVPIFWRIGMPIIFVSNIAMFLSGHLSLGASVSLSIEFGGEEIVRVDNFYSFWLGKSIVEIWEAGAKALAALMCIFSAIWPYTKQLINLFLWCASTKHCSIKTRGEILHWVDILGKWSMVDIFVIVMSLVGFWIAIDSPQVFAFLPKDLYAIKLFVRPMWGLYANLIAQLISQLSSHIFIHYHRRVEEDGMKVLKADMNEEKGGGDDENQEEILRDYVYHLKCKDEGKTVQVHHLIDFLFGILMMASGLLVILGCAMPSFQLDILGIVGLLVEMKSGFKDDALTKHSVFSVAGLLWKEAQYLDTTNDYVGLFTLITVIISTSFIVPLALIGTLIWLWFGSMDKKSRNRTLVAIEVLQAWQYVEVYIVSVLVTIWQLGDVSSFLVNESCASLNDTFSLLVFLGVIKKDDAQCLYVQANILSGLFLLLLASLFLAFVSRFIVKAAKQRDGVDVDAANLKIDLTKIRAVYGGEDPVVALEAQAQSVAEGKSEVIPKPGIPLPISEEYPCFFAYVDLQEQTVQAPSRMILSYDGNVNSISVAAVQAPSRMIVSYDGNVNSISVFDKNSTKSSVSKTESSKSVKSTTDGTNRTQAQRQSNVRASNVKSNNAPQKKNSTKGNLSSEKIEYLKTLNGMK